MTRGQWVAVDFDHTLWDNHNNRPMPGAQDAIEELHNHGLRVIVHSCNRPAFIREMCEEHRLYVDAVWGELPGQEGQKPVAAVYVDDRGLRFDGDWAETTRQVLEMVADRPVRR